jgi:hypothetical protein
VQREYRIVWNSGFELSEKDKAAVELQQAQARNLKTGWMSVDEVRAEQGLGGLPDGAGQVVLGLQKTTPQAPLPSSNSEVDMDEGLLKNLLKRLRRTKDA